MVYFDILVRIVHQLLFDHKYVIGYDNNHEEG